MCISTYVQLRRFSPAEEGQPRFTLDVGNAVAQMMAGSRGTVHAPALVPNRGYALREEEERGSRRKLWSLGFKNLLLFSSERL